MPIDVEFEDVTDKKGKEGKVAEEVVELIEKHFLVPEEIVQGVKVRAIWKLGKPWFCLADLCAALGKKGTAAAFDDVTSLREAGFGDGIGHFDTVDEYGRKQSLTFIDEGAMWRVLMRSSAKNAMPIQQWVCREVLPAIRETGRYELPGAQQQVGCSDLDRQLALLAQNCLAMSGTVLGKTGRLEAVEKDVAGVNNADVGRREGNSKIRKNPGAGP